MAKVFILQKSLISLISRLLKSITFAKLMHGQDLQLLHLHSHQQIHLKMGCLSSILILRTSQTNPSRKLTITTSCLSNLSKTSPNLTFILSSCYYIAHIINNKFSLSFISDDSSLKDS
jgi:hypothetical protein